MRSLVRLVLFAIALGASAHARAEDEVEVSLYWNGQRLTKICRSYLKASRRELLTVAEVQDKGLCQGYVVGAVGAMFTETAISRTVFFCSPAHTDQTALVEIVAQYGVAHPEEWTGTGFALVSHALAKRFPCK